ncbi:unnamed protein product [Rhizoctonia solani]|uniref:ubiquitinyl hydrolase 1 n=1 Tax=Rhizoctonia solani TaxID=456999 RepID=A0A8H2Y604_9AGAM|nr:unnamed protein product [Rhizoctonia solani]
MAEPAEFEVLQHLVYNVFLPPKLPQEEPDESLQEKLDLDIIDSILQAIQEFSAQSETNLDDQWSRVKLMIEKFRKYMESHLEKGQLNEDMKKMKLQGSLMLYIRAQNTGLIIRKKRNHTTFEAFEAQPRTEDVMSTPGKLIRQFPGPVVQVPNSVANDEDFIAEVANILSQTNNKSFDKAHPKTRKAGTDVLESRDSINPNYFIQYFFGFLRGVGDTIHPPRIVKHLADEVLWLNAKNPWRRSPIWLIIRVALQTSLDSATSYKHLMAYHHSRVISRSYHQDEFSSDLLYAMRIKMAKRLYRVKDTAPQFIVDASQAAANGTQYVLQKRWNFIQSAQAQSLNQDFSILDFESAVNHTLPNSRDYLDQVFQGRSSTSEPSGFNKTHSPRLEHVTDFSQYANGAMARAFENDPHLALYDFEGSVFGNISEWTFDRKQENTSGACATVFSCFRQYLAAAKSHYTTDVADQSIMMLTLTRLWMAIDELATNECPLLLKFSPELPQDFLDPLLLRTSQHIEQARIVRNYIRERHNGAFSDNPRILSDRITPRCFAVQYFRTSSRHQKLKATIETYAQGQKDQKIKELEEINAQYKQLDEEIQGMNHDYHEQPNERRIHLQFCERCIREKRKSELGIQPYEWPLPRSQPAAKAVVFELDRPESFVIWRDVTYELLVDLGSSPRDRCDRQATLEEYGALAKWLSTPPAIEPRVIIASVTKSFKKSHYNYIRRLPATESQVCLNNALLFRLYDSRGESWATGPFNDVTLNKFGTFRLPPGSPYHYLEYAVKTTTHTFNQVLADQHRCPKELSLHEHTAFGSLWSGAHLQWMNIVRGLEEDLLSFSSEEVWLIHAQAAWQIGPLSDDGSCPWHEELGSFDYGYLLVSQCRRVLGRVKANWLQSNAVLIIVTLVNRLLASLPEAVVVQEACSFLREARLVVHKWMLELLKKLEQATDKESVIGYQHRVCEVAAICRTTYDVEPHHINHLLSTSSDYTILIECSIRLHDNRPPNIQNAPYTLQSILCRDRQLALKLASYILASVRQKNDIFSDPVFKIWPGYRRGLTGWKALDPPNGRWVTTTTTVVNEDRKQQVHLNIVTGELLVDARTIGRLPRRYVEHLAYTRLFGQKILDVVPAKSPMKFETRDKINGYKVSFLQKGKQLIIQAFKDERLYELIPHEMLSQDFPLFLVEDYHHWADVGNKTIDFRPISSPWSDDKCQWFLQFDEPRGTILTNPRSGSFLINIHSAAFKLIASQICPLESDQYLHIVRSPTNRIEAELPRMKLSFFINENMELESRNFRDQVLDENQSSGTLFGLKNQLLLRAKGAVLPSTSQVRSVLIPDGEVTFIRNGHHISVSVQFDSRRNVEVYQYKIDTNLNYLTTDAGLTSRLFKIYLHALTSYCLPDPLTGRTGTEEALHELSQASTWSFEQLSLKQASLLKSIGLLTPKRRYYPEHLQCMQTTYWSDLPSLSQHFGFSFTVKKILLRADTLQVFHPLDFKLSDLMAVLESSDTLLKRATRQTMMYYPSNTSIPALPASGSTTRLDYVCPGRDNLTGDWEKLGQAARWASSMVHHNWRIPIFAQYDLVSEAEKWSTLKDSVKCSTLCYNPSWLKMDLKSSWLSIYNILRREAASTNKYKLSACFACMAFAEDVPTGLIPILLAFANNPGFRSLDPPPNSAFNFKDGYEPVRGRVEDLVSKFTYPIEATPAATLVQTADESDLQFRRRKEKYHHEKLPKLQFIESLLNQWPSVRQHPSIELRSFSVDDYKWFDVSSCLKSTTEYFSSCAWNVKMRDHLRILELRLTSRPTSAATTFNSIIQESVPVPLASPVPNDPWSVLSIFSLMRSRPAPSPNDIFLLPKFRIFGQSKAATDTSRLADLLAEFRDTGNDLNSRYGEDLDKSRRALASSPSITFPQQFPPPTTTFLEQSGEHCAKNVSYMFERLKLALSPETAIERILSTAGVWPRIIPSILLQQLCIQNRHRFDSLLTWRNSLIEYAQGLAHHQRSHRLITLAKSNSTEEFYKELDVTSSECDIGTTDPDWLLVQIDGNFGVRSLQRQVAQAMISPASCSSTVLQLNMGEGKSSVIVPIVASSLADPSRLVRVVVLKPLWRQMFELLVNRLSGLANRRIYYLPFGRHIQINESSAAKLRILYEECMHEGGILLAQPEHILSFKLMGIDRLISSRTSKGSEATAAKQLRDIQEWLKSHTRDILDESDEVLHVRYQLVYTLGKQEQLEDHPDRWTTTQQLLHLTAINLKRFEMEHPNDILYVYKDFGQFPTLRIMPDCGNALEKNLISAIAIGVLDGQLANLGCNRLPPSVRESLVEFLVNNELPHPTYVSLQQRCDPTLWKGLLLVRGLLASGALIFALKHKYYRIDYGLDLSRSLLAVPYRAKDIPSLRAEFGHPDVAIVLTCLSYYYHGLTQDDLDLCFKHLFKLDNPSLEYEQWAKRNKEIPDDLKQLNGVNIKDRQQFEDIIIPNFSHNSATIDFFLSVAIFPKAAKQFPQKLATSGWDLVEKKKYLTTGFSGTNDNRYLLPTSITQSDPVNQLGTNALVLTYLLQPENNFYMCMRDKSGRTLSTKEFLHLLVSQIPEVRVLLDVGAQMLELRNEELVRCWLGKQPDVEAAVYFNDQDELVVLPQHGSPALLSSSPFARRLDKCIVYLDDGHTRGTDLQLPKETRALVTLGPKVTKDRLLQGCMRMRKLGHGQSVMFAAPPEIDAQIRNVAPNPISSETPINTLDVLRWAMMETCKDLQHHAGHWAQQGIDFERRQQAEKEYEQNRQISVLEQGWMAPESQTLEHMYGVMSPGESDNRGRIIERAFEVPGLRASLEELGIASLKDPSMDEEQEREVHHEVEQQPQTLRPLEEQPVKPAIHQDVSQFINTGNLSNGQSGIIPLFHPFHTSNPQISNWSNLLFAPVDFLRTTVGSTTDTVSEYMRPVNWIVSGSGAIRVVLSPHEVNELMPLIRKSSVVRLHVYAPRVSLAMRSFSDLQFYSIPAILKTLTPSTPLSVAQLQLDLFAGQLYFSSYQDYTSFCAMLGLFIPSTDRNLDIETETDGFVKPKYRAQLTRHPEYLRCHFTTTPIPNLKELIGQRRKGMKYLLTHVGQVLHARNLTPEDFNVRNMRENG